MALFFFSIRLELGLGTDRNGCGAVRCGAVHSIGRFYL